MTPGVARHIIASFEGQPKTTIRLTDKEWAPLRDLTEGLRYKEIAGNLSISLNSRLWERIAAVTNELGQVSAQTNSYTELETSMHRWANGHWVEGSADSS